MPSSPISSASWSKVEFFRPEEKRGTMSVNLRNIFQRMAPTQQDIRTLHGVIMAIAQGRKGPARGGVLDGGRGADAARSAGRARRRPRAGRARPGARPGAAAAPQSDRGRARVVAGAGATTAASPAAASSGRCRSARTSPISCRSRCKCVIDLVPAQESERRRARAPNGARGCSERGYRVSEVRAAEVERDVASAGSLSCVRASVGRHDHRSSREAVTR